MKTKYTGNPDEEKDLVLAIIVVIECKDYSSSNPIPVDDVEEFYAKLQQLDLKRVQDIVGALTEKEFISYKGENFFSLTGDRTFESMITNLLNTSYI